MTGIPTFAIRPRFLGIERADPGAEITALAAAMMARDGIALPAPGAAQRFGTQRTCQWP